MSKPRKTFAFSSRINMKVFASLTEFLTRHGMHELTQSSVARAIFEMLYEHLRKSDPNFVVFDSTTEALKYLKKLGIFTGEHNRAFRGLISQVQSESLMDDFGTDIYMAPQTKQDSKVNTCDLDDAIKVLQEQAKKRDENFQKIQEELAKGGKPNEKESR